MTLPPLELFDHEAVCDAIRAAEDWYEGPVLRRLGERGRQEGLIVDAGAHIGNHSVYWLENANPSSLLALEPMPETFDLLRRNLARYPNAIALPLALSSDPGMVRLVRDEVNLGRSYIAREGTVRAVAVRLDDLPVDGISLLKVDVEGWQAHVLRGARAALTRWHPAILVEDIEQVVGQTLADLSLGGYRLTESMPGANYLWEWT
jgi:FkbM family methyltransferase